MKLARRICYWFSGLFSKEKFNADMEAEMQLHLELRIEKNITSGMKPDEARYAAFRAFGGVDQIKERCRDGITWRLREDLVRDIRLTARILRKNFGFTAVAVLTLALCIGANTAIFSMVYALLLKPLPFPEPSRIVGLHNVFDSKSMDSNLVQYVDYKTHATSYDAVGLWRLKSSTIGNDGAEERITAASCTPEMFGILGVVPLIGNFFTAENCRLGENRVVVLTESYWEAQFGRDPGVLGKPLQVDGETSRIIGVAPRSVEAFDSRMKFIKPEAWKPSWIDPTQRYYLDTPLYARLKRDVPASQAQAEAAAIEHRFYDGAPDWNKKLLDHASYRVTVEPVQATRTEPLMAPLYLLQGGVVLVLLIGCVNVSNLLLVRANGRQGELAIRLAIGATRGAIARQLLVESLMLTLGGAALGVGGAYGAIHAINHYSAAMLPATMPFAIDWRVLGFTVAVSLLVGLTIGMLPMANVLSPGVAVILHHATRTASGSRKARALSGTLIIGQVAVTLVLLAAAGLLVHSFANAVAVKPGFDPENLMTARIALGRPYWNDHGAIFQKQLIQSLSEIPGVSGVALAEGVPFEGGLDSNVLTLKDSPLPSNSVQPNAYQVGVSAGYFEALHIRLLEGRYMNEHDVDGVEYIVDERFAKKYFPGRSALGAHFTFQNRHLPAKTEDWPVIVGVVQNIPHTGVEDLSNTPFTYYPLLKAQPEEPNLFVRSARPLDDLILAIREKLHGLDRDIPLYHVETLRTAIDESFNNRRAVMLLLGSFSVLALFLSAVGIYGSLAFDVSQRTREIGIRGAMGGSRTQIVGMVMRQGLSKAAIGLSIGLGVAVLVCRLMEGMLYDLKPTDPWALVLSSILLGTIAAFASYIPAERAAKIDPVEALRME
jgi:predicted permease